MVNCLTNFNNSNKEVTMLDFVIVQCYIPQELMPLKPFKLFLIE